MNSCLGNARDYWNDFSSQVSLEYKDHWINAEGFALSEHLYVEVADFIKSYIPTGHSSVLEVGCGTGRILSSLSQIHHGNIIGIDFSSKQIETAYNVLGRYRHVEIFNEDICSYYEKNCGKKFDLIFLHSVTQYFPSEEYFQRFLSYSKNLLNKGGSLLLIDVPISWNDSSRGERKNKMTFSKSYNERTGMKTLMKMIRYFWGKRNRGLWRENIENKEVVTRPFRHYFVEPEELYKFSLENFEIFEQLHQQFPSKPKMYTKYRPIYVLQRKL